MELLTPRQDHVSDVKSIDDPGVDTEFFNLLLPLPYRVAILLTLGVWLWAANLRGLMSKNMRVDVPALIRYPSRMQQNQLKHWQSTNRFAIMLTVPLSVSLLLFWILSRFDESLVLRWELLGDFTLLAIVCALLLPSLQVPWMRTVAPSGRARFAKALRRVALGGIATTDEGRFGDVILADALTSYSKVVGDLFVVACMLLRWPHPTAKPDRDCGGAITVPLLMALPFLIRFSQCLIEFRRVRSGQYGEGHGWGGTHLLNAAKYFTAFPVFFFSTRMAPHEYREGGWGYDFWRIAAVINSLYSFYWDVAKDWDLELFSSKRSSSDYPWGLRKDRKFQSPSVYYVVIVIDLVLRLTWSIKLSPHMLDYVDMEGTMFLLEIFEILRRWMWIFFRIETECVREERRQRSMGAGRPGDLLLGSLGTERYEDD